MVGAGETLRGCGARPPGGLWVMVMPPEGDGETPKLNLCWALIRDEATRPCSLFSHSPSQAITTSTFPPKAPLGEETWGAELRGYSVGIHPGFSRRRILGNRADTRRDCGPFVEPRDSCPLLGCTQGQSCL